MVRLVGDGVGRIVVIPTTHAVVRMESCERPILSDNPYPRYPRSYQAPARKRRYDSRTLPPFRLKLVVAKWEY